MKQDKNKFSDEDLITQYNLNPKLTALAHYFGVPDITLWRRAKRLGLSFKIGGKNIKFELVDILNGKHPQYPKKDWWWNGASPLFDTLDYVVDKNGIDNVVITVKSYVAGGNYDEVEIKFPTSFIDLPENEFKETVSNWLLNEIKVYNEAQKAKKELEAKQQIAFLQAELDRLKSA